MNGCNFAEVINGKPQSCRMHCSFWSLSDDKNKKFREDKCKGHLHTQVCKFCKGRGDIPYDKTQYHSCRLEHKQFLDSEEAVSYGFV